MIICYVTNPIVVLFADEVGELKGFLHYWQTWDDSLDSEFMMKEVVPNSLYGKFINYDWDSKYESYKDTETLKEYGHVIDKVRLREGATFSTKERIQRYFCRVLWIMRNCGYGFAFYMFGASGDIKDVKVVSQEGNEKLNAYDTNSNWLTRNWSYKFYEKLFGNVYVAGYLGWKIPIWHDEGKYKAMIVNRVVLRFHPPKD